MRDHEDRAEHDARDRIGDLDVEAEDVRQQLVAAEQDAADHARDRADQKADDCFFERHRHLLPERPLRGAVGDPFDDLVPDQRGHRVEERVDQLGARRQLPAAEHDHEHCYAQRDDGLVIAANAGLRSGRFAGQRLVAEG